MNKKSLTLGTIFIFGQILTQIFLFNLIFVNTDMGFNGLAAGIAISTIAVAGFISLFCGAILASSRYYNSFFAQATFSLIISSFFLFMFVLERMYGNLIAENSIGLPHLMPVMCISIILAFWILLQITRKKNSL